MTAALIINAVLAAGVFAVVVAHHAWSILTQHRDRAHVFVRDRVRPRRHIGVRPRPAESRPGYVRPEARPGQAWPAA